MKSPHLGDTRTVWDDVLLGLSSEISKQSFTTWFQPTSLLSDDGLNLVVAVPNSLYLDWLGRSFSLPLSRVLSSIGRADAKVSFQLADGPEIHPVAASSQQHPRSSKFSGRYTFENFVVGQSNQFAHAAAVASSAAPSSSYNPLFIHSEVGLGKTHLLHAIGNFIARNFPHLCVSYVTVERFTNEMINALRFDRILDFRSRYRSVDVLLVDDIQFVSGKEGTQNELFHTFNALHDAEKQIILTSDRPPHEITTLSERLRSRFEWGLIADIQPADLDTKISILQRKAQLDNIRLDAAAACFIAELTSNIRELEGMLNRIAAAAEYEQRPIDLHFATRILQGTTQRKPKLSVELIQEHIASHFRLTVSDLTSRSNTQAIVVPRQIGMYLTKMLTSLSLPEIGRKFGGKHHSTVIQSIRKIESRIAVDQDFKAVIEQLRSSLQSAPRL